MKNIVTIVGARPQFIKAAVISRLLQQHEFKTKISEFLVHTGQHYDHNMSDIFFHEMEIPKPDINLEIGSGSHGAMTGAMLQKIEKLIFDRNPDAVLIYGDTNSTLAGALAASKNHIPVIHVEAGLRSFMMQMPEEQNRIIADRLSTILFCPTENAIKNLENEGIKYDAGKKITIDNKGVFLSGDVMYDASLYYKKIAEQKHKESKIAQFLDSDFFLITIHRAENTDNIQRLCNIVNAINSFTDIRGVLPLHPRTKKILKENKLEFKDHIAVIDPVGYFDMILLESNCKFVVTDSGGVQKEAFFYKKPCVTLRDSTEWVELCEMGWNTLVGADTNKIIEALRTMPKYGKYISLYGEGDAGQKILKTILNNL